MPAAAVDIYAPDFAHQLTRSQYFWNVPINDPLHQDLVYFYSTMEMINEGLEAADCLGSGFIVRRSALAQIDGFPTYSVTEDTACSSQLVGQGWRVAYIKQRLQCGEMPETLSGHLKQRMTERTDTGRAMV